MREPAVYVKRPVPVRAIQWTGDNVRAVREFVGVVVGHDGIRTEGFLPTGKEGPSYLKSAYLWVAANKAWLPIEIGEWVLRDASGCYPCKHERFVENYHPSGDGIVYTEPEIGRKVVDRDGDVWTRGENGYWWLSEDMVDDSVVTWQTLSETSAPLRIIPEGSW